MSDVLHSRSVALHHPLLHHPHYPWGSLLRRLSLVLHRNSQCHGTDSCLLCPLEPDQDREQQGVLISPHVATKATSHHSAHKHRVPRENFLPGPSVFMGLKSMAKLTVRLMSVSFFVVANGLGDTFCSTFCGFRGRVDAVNIFHTFPGINKQCLRNFILDSRAMQVSVSV